MTVLNPLKAIREHCLDCSGDSRPAVIWCPCDGIHGSSCPLWPYRFGKRPATFIKQHGKALLTPEAMPPGNTDLESLPGTVSEAVKWVERH